MKDRSSKLRMLILLATAALFAVACYTIQAPKKSKKVPRSESASKELHETIFEYVQESLFTYPQLATRAGVHKHRLPSGETVDLDRELPNYSEDVVASRVDALKGYKETLDKKAPKDALCRNDLADRLLLVNAIDYEIDMLDGRKMHTNNPLVHVVALAEAVYYPIALEYAPESERAADLLGRMHWMPSYVDRAMRLLEKSSDAYNGPAAKINAWTIKLIENDLAKMVDGDDATLESYKGMKPPVLDSLKKFQSFLESGIKKKGKSTWRLGRDRYEEHFGYVFNGLSSPEDASEQAKARMDELRAEMYQLAKPIYCENKETDRDVCGPTKAEIAAVKRAEEKRIADEERKAKAEEEKLAREEERKAKEEERKAKAEEKKAAREEAKKAKEEERLAKEEERKAKAEERKAAREEAKKAKEDAKKAKEEEKDKDDDDDEGIDNPYEDKKPKKKEKKKDKGGVSNPYAMGTLRVPVSVGAKLGDDEDEDDEEEKKETKKAKKETKKAEKKDKKEARKEKKAEKKRVSAETMDRVVGFVVRMIAKGKPASNRPLARLERQMDGAASMATDAKILGNIDTEGLSVGAMPAFVSQMGVPFAYNPAPVFQPDQGANIWVTGDANVSMADLARPWMTFVALYHGSPGKHEVHKRVSSMDNQTRRAMRGLFADKAYVEGWALMSATMTLAAMDDEDDVELKLVGLAAELQAAAMVVVDHGLHALGWKDKRAKEYLEERAYLEAATAEGCMQSIKLAPLQSSAPFIGLNQWRVVADAVEEKYGDEFTHRAFANDALKLGAVPLGGLAEMLIHDPELAPEDDAEIAEEDDGPKHVSIFSAK